MAFAQNHYQLTLLVFHTYLTFLLWLQEGFIYMVIVLSCLIKADLLTTYADRYFAVQGITSAGFRPKAGVSPPKSILSVN